ncbi:MAG: eal/GGDEF/PAS domain-containing protein [Coleofasciculus sp. Co-bin14]|nr:eal/GGDEF/PAS domain-containing protein [Coleofasciculus sp. Co-bin14]
MPQTEGSDKVTAVMPKSLKEQLKEYAESKRWTMSQAVVYLVEKGLEEEYQPPNNPKKRS